MRPQDIHIGRIYSRRDLRQRLMAGRKVLRISDGIGCYPSPGYERVEYTVGSARGPVRKICTLSNFARWAQEDITDDLRGGCQA